MSDFSKPILLSGLAAIVIYVIICIAATLAAFTLFAAYSVKGALTPAAETAIVAATQRAALVTPAGPANDENQTQTDRTNHNQAPAINPGVAESESTPTADVPSPLPQATHTASAIPTASETPLPTPDFAATEAQATLLAEQAASPTSSPQPTSLSVPTDLTSAIQKLVEDGLLASDKGSYATAQDYEDTWNKIDWHRWTYIEETPANFILRAKASWNTTAVAGMTANSGCGFVFRENGPENYYLIYLGINGRAYFYRMMEGAIKYLGNSIYYPIESPQGSADLMLYVNDIRFMLFVDGENIYDVMDGYFMEGKIGLTVLSGSAQGKGTTCRMENIELWSIEQ